MYVVCKHSQARPERRPSTSTKRRKAVKDRGAKKNKSHPTKAARPLPLDKWSTQSPVRCDLVASMHMNAYAAAAIRITSGPLVDLVGGCYCPMWSCGAGSPVL